MAKRKRAHSEVEFDLETIRHIKRLATRVVRYLVMVEKHLKKTKARTRKASKEEIDAAFELYGGKPTFK